MRFHMGRVLSIMALAALTALPASAGNLRIFGAYLDSGDVGSFTGAGVKYASSNNLGWEFGVTAYLDSDDFNFSDLDFGGNTVDNTAWDLGFRASASEIFYVCAGVSYFQFDADYGDIDDEWGFYGTLGASFGGDTFRFFVEAMYRYVDATIKFENLDLVQESVDLDIGGFGANAGLEWRF